MIKQVSMSVDNYGISKFLFYRRAEHEVIDAAQIEWLAKSRIPGLLPCVTIETAGEAYVRYDLISEETLAETGKVTREKLYSWLADTAETLMEAGKAGLDTGNFVLNKGQVFIDPFSNRLVFIYIPVKNNTFEKRSLKEFILELMSLAPYEENGKSALFFIRVHNYLLGREDVQPDEIASRLAEWATQEEIPIEVSRLPRHKPEYYSPGKLTPEAAERMAASREEQGEKHRFEEASRAIPRSTGEGRGLLTSEYTSLKKDRQSRASLEIEEEVQYKRITRTDLGDRTTLPSALHIVPKTAVPEVGDYEEEGTTVLGMPDEEEGTTILGALQKPFLLAAESGEKITLSKDVFRIGRDPNGTDYTSANSVVGRVHAIFLTEDGEYFFEDNFSRNGSYINGVKAVPGKRIKIKHEDKIRLANEEYMFRLF